jgi:hypothetical protein
VPQAPAPRMAKRVGMAFYMRERRESAGPAHYTGVAGESPRKKASVLRRCADD